MLLLVVLRAVAYVDTMQCILLAGGIMVIGVIALVNIGGFGALVDGIAALSQIDEKLTPDGYSHYIAIPGVIQYVKKWNSSHWRCLDWDNGINLCVCTMGIQSAPAFTMWSFSNKSVVFAATGMGFCFWNWFNINGFHSCSRHRSFIF